MTISSKSVASYRDVHLVFEKVGSLGTVVLTFDSYREAAAWVARANAYRVLLRKQNALEGRDHVSPFDHILVSRQTNSNVVTVRPRGFNFIARTADGDEIALSHSTIDTPTVQTPHEVSVSQKQHEAEEDYESFLNDFNAANKEQD